MFIFCRFCAQILRENVSFNLATQYEQPVHHIYLLPTVKLDNRLPIDIQFNLSGERGRIKAGTSSAVTSVNKFSIKILGILNAYVFQVNPGKVVELEIKIDSFYTCNAIVVPSGCTSDFGSRIKLEDTKQRTLYLSAYVSFNKGAKLKVVEK